MDSLSLFVCSLWVDYQGREFCLNARICPSKFVSKLVNGKWTFMTIYKILFITKNNIVYITDFVYPKICIFVNSDLGCKTDKAFSLKNFTTLGQYESYQELIGRKY